LAALGAFCSLERDAKRRLSFKFREAQRIAARGKFFLESKLHHREIREGMINSSS